jgi:hypothetical protein
VKLLPKITVLATVALVGCETSSGASGAGDKPPATSVSAATAKAAPASPSDVPAAARGGAVGAGDVPPAAVQACIGGADDFWSAKPGTSVVYGGHPTDQGFWSLQMATGSLQSTCTVTPIGGIINIGPGG